MIRSGRSCCASSSASWPSSAVSTVKPALRSFSETTLRMCDSSSQTRIFFAPIAGPSFTQFQLKPERTSPTHVALNEHSALVDGFDNVADQGQAQAGALGHAVVDLGPVELIEHERQVLWGDADAGVHDARDHLAVGLVHRGLHRDRPAGGRVLD